MGGASTGAREWGEEELSVFPSVTQGVAGKAENTSHLSPPLKPSQHRLVLKVVVLFSMPAWVWNMQQRSQAAHKDQTEGKCSLQVPEMSFWSKACIDSEEVFHDIMMG